MKIFFKATEMKMLVMTMLFFAIMFQGCKDDDSEDPVIASENVKLSDNTDLGNILVDGEGRTLYFFAQDVSGESRCEAGTCLNNWPVFYVEEIDPGAGLSASDFENITREDGEKQTTYKGWPLYYFASDSKPGDTNGEAVNNVWFVAKPDYSIMFANAQLIGNDGKNYTNEYIEGDGMTQYFVDAEGRTLYAFLSDSKDDNNYTNPDFSNDDFWPIFHVDIAALPSSIDPTDFSEIDVFGRPQLTFKGWPLYYFGPDAQRGDNKGVSVPNPGVWPIVNNDTQEAPGAVAENIKLSNNDVLGDVLVDANGATLYFFTKDVNGESACTDGSCLANWPVFYVENLTPGEGLNLTDFAEITREDGEKQTTYKGWPLYYFANDSEPGDINGEAVSNVWFVAKPDYSIMLANAQLIGHDGKNYTSEYVEGEAITQYFVDSEGRTLYAFINDSNNDNNFTNEDFSNDAVWPVFHVDINSLPSTVDEADFDVIDVFGTSQLTYKGWPLYYFGQDGVRGDNKGVSFPAPGIWPIVNTSTAVAL